MDGLRVLSDMVVQSPVGLTPACGDAPRDMAFALPARAMAIVEQAIRLCTTDV
jgi:hypothetical protein